MVLWRNDCIEQNVASKRTGRSRYLVEQSEEIGLVPTRLEYAR